MFNFSTNCLCPIRIATNSGTPFSMRTSSLKTVIVLMREKWLATRQYLSIRFCTRLRDKFELIIKTLV